jgi:hypothetical protein
MNPLYCSPPYQTPIGTTQHCSSLNPIFTGLIYRSFNALALDGAIRHINAYRNAEPGAGQLNLFFALGCSVIFVYTFVYGDGRADWKKLEISR